MSFFASAFREETKKYKDAAMSSEATFPVSYPTTFLPLDYANGMNVVNDVIDSDITYTYDALGIGAGSINALIGRAGTAKSTFAVQVMCAIISQFKNSVGIYDDAEGGMSLQRIQNVSGLSTKEIARKIIHRNVGVNAENFFERVSLHCNQKIEAALTCPEEVTYFTGIYDYYGNPVNMLIPTVYVLDSLALLMPKDLSDEEKLKGQMLATAQAKCNSQIFKRLAPKLKEANVILLFVNHVNDKVEINPFAKTQAQVNYMGQNESIPGGFMPIYLSNNIFKFTASDKLTADKGLGINGFITKIKLVKSRSNRAGQEIRMVYDQVNGFDRVLTCYEFLKENGMIKGAGSSFYVVGCEDVKFAQKNFYKKFIESERLREAMKDATMEVCSQMIPKFEKNEAQMSKHELMERLCDAFSED